MPPRALPQQTAMDSPATEVSSPCIGICSLNRDDVCQGCWRTLGEISRWTRMETAEQATVLQRAARRRQTAQAAQQ